MKDSIASMYNITSHTVTDQGKFEDYQRRKNAGVRAKQEKFKKERQFITERQSQMEVEERKMRNRFTRKDLCYPRERGFDIVTLGERGPDIGSTGRVTEVDEQLRKTDGVLKNKNGRLISDIRINQERQRQWEQSNAFEKCLMDQHMDDVNQQLQTKDFLHYSSPNKTTTSNALRSDDVLWNRQQTVKVSSKKTIVPSLKLRNGKSQQSESMESIESTQQTQSAEQKPKRKNSGIRTGGFQNIDNEE
eukprot:TRINITY_DN440_c3_g1_i1.p1 TRINITY_DN440_c3_g1~~TRINITY_DN440_c3_g1_i1.p1  ORF type:complete len:247 (-),score=94.67 TRINITY_DN440_c3_g1_i1:278-1018(-)